MTTRRALVGAGLLAVTSVTAACAGSAEYPTPGDDSATVIVVDNTRSMVSSMTVHLVGQHGIRMRLGTVRLNERKHFTVPRSATGTFQLLAEPQSGGEFASQHFALAKGDRLEWSLDLNRIRFRGNAFARR